MGDPNSPATSEDTEDKNQSKLLFLRTSEHARGSNANDDEAQAEVPLLNGFVHTTIVRNVPMKLSIIYDVMGQ